MALSRRDFVGGGLALAAAAGLGPNASHARTSGDQLDGYGFMRARTIPKAVDLEPAMMDMLASLYQEYRRIDGYLGYVAAHDLAVENGFVTACLVATTTGVPDIVAAGNQYVESLHPRFVTSVAVDGDGPLRAMAVTTRRRSEVPPYLSGSTLQLRYRQHAPGYDWKKLGVDVQNGLAPMLAAMPGFVLYALTVTESGRTGFDIWDTAEHAAAGAAALAGWVDEHAPNSWSGEVQASTARVAWADLRLPE